MSKHRLQMQRRQPIMNRDPIQVIPEQMEQTRINQYTCQTCGGVITTVDRDHGTTPAMLVCRATEGCTGSMWSAMYRCDQTLKPDYEWYLPAKLPRDPGMRQHVEMSGLLIRKLVDA